jgi:hypothetical protein
MTSPVGGSSRGLISSFTTTVRSPPGEIKDTESPAGGSFTDPQVKFQKTESQNSLQLPEKIPPKTKQKKLLKTPHKNFSKNPIKNT